MPLDDAPFITADIPPLGGRIRERAEDFVVEEMPQYEPCGQGEHVYLFLEKRGLSTSQLVHLIAQHFGVRRDAVGYAGMKDKHAVTRQWISVHTPGKSHTDFPMLRNDRVTVMIADMHSNKLRLGHLRGNRFSIKIRGVDATRVLAARRVLHALARDGVPNFAGAQRFGIRQNNHRLGRAMLLGLWQEALDELLGPDPAYPQLNTEAREHYLRGEFGRALDGFPNACRHERIALRVLEQGAGAKRAISAVEITQRRFWFSALQSHIFNRLLRRRIEEKRFATLIDGDVACKLENGAMFKVDQAVLDDPATPARLERYEISPTGPFWGVSMMRAQGSIDQAEIDALAEEGISIEALAKAVKMLGPSMSGARRPFRIPLQDPQVDAGVDEHGHYIRCAFGLSAGAFATVVMREITKNPDDIDDDGSIDQKPE